MSLLNPALNSCLYKIGSVNLNGILKWENLNVNFSNQQCSINLNLEDENQILNVLFEKKKPKPHWFISPEPKTKYIDDVIISC